MALFNEIYSNIDQTNIGVANKTGTGKIVLQTAPTIIGATFAGDVNLWGGSDLKIYSDGGTTLKFQVDGATGDATTSGKYAFNANNYFVISSANIIAAVANGSTMLTIDGVAPVLRLQTDLNLQPTKKLFWDNGGDTLTYESSADVLDTLVGSVNVLRLTSSSVKIFNADASIDPTKKLYYDNSGDTYTTESSANVLDTYTNGNLATRINATSDMTVFQPRLITRNIKPYSTDNYDIGSSGTNYRELYLSTITDPPTANALNAMSGVKGWAYVSVTGATTVTLLAGYNVASVTASGWVVTINWGTAFASQNYVVIGSTDSPSAYFLQCSATSAGVSTITPRDTAGANPANLWGGGIIAIGKQ